MPRRQPEEREFDEKVVAINRVAKVVQGGRRFSFTALVVVGDRKGRVGAAHAKAPEIPDAIRKAIHRAKKDLLRVPLVGATLPHPVIGEFGASRVLLKPAAPGTGVIAGSAVRAVLELAGVGDVLSKVLGSTNPLNVVFATVEALRSMRDVEHVAQLRGKRVEEVAG